MGSCARLSLYLLALANTNETCEKVRRGSGIGDTNVLPEIKGNDSSRAWKPT